MRLHHVSTLLWTNTEQEPYYGNTNKTTFRCPVTSRFVDTGHLNRQEATSRLPRNKVIEKLVASLDMKFPFIVGYSNGSLWESRDVTWGQYASAYSFMAFLTSEHFFEELQDLAFNDTSWRNRKILAFPTPNKAPVELILRQRKPTKKSVVIIES